MSKPKTPRREPASREARRLAAVILDVLAGSRTPQQAAEALSVSLPRYYQLEAKAVNGLVDACEVQPRGRQPEVATELKRVNKEVERLRRELSRSQTLVRLTQRTVGVSAPPPVPAKAGKSGRRKRKPVVRALRRVEELQAESSDSAVEEVEIGVE